MYTENFQMKNKKTQNMKIHKKKNRKKLKSKIPR